MKALSKIQAIILSFFTMAAILIMGMASEAKALEAAIGPAAGTYPGLSFQLVRDHDQSYHLGMQVSEDNAYIINLDIQRVLVPHMGSWFNLAVPTHLYGGVGALMRAKPKQDIDRLLYYHMPIGLQFDYSDGIVHAFTEAALILGPMPKTTASVMPMVGVRTRF